LPHLKLARKFKVALKLAPQLKVLKLSRKNQLKVLKLALKLKLQVLNLALKLKELELKMIQLLA
jgi:hypothetical protein